MTDTPNFGRRLQNYRPSKSTWFWSCAACVIATIVVGFNWGGWVTGGTASKMAADAASGAAAQLAAADCITRFKSRPDAAVELATLKKANSYDQRDMIKKGGWATMAGSKAPIPGAAEICAQRLSVMDLPAPNAPSTAAKG